ncbi:uncharacterized protein LOC120775689 isoform X1 [Bactrocera tryoni]|uniref:uncharacterized protein LOC120775689 isoform X1 n=1 Tax=Bactrocera tryoni TaxID=59916 RepID=UPI001A9A0EA7|nr:uncharacterized protein LOC120775689 isoform X1 [Bactrocera tryoni]XP_039961924.1 uncharacterized protein LOC120775689 isoform X1 [Bactrocera tryoni]XP_039961925.1 uncharacterized protein LOC120775689 isoform X1 [Bactrocera tryoni]XP_039961926.1 uncharacterized protein LOC120775689 isoform X1 [Bactrocera tryoni]XP_039961927.1 uncharacterized protein LOC120775689 isoform X1 [Bactrocera tryoni]XP_039961928.1 uncharacterized protein LOC120775689 isoform X1 [Bactrocera tryoni]XP_039961929.1 un
MSEIARNDASTESLCTVIENFKENSNTSSNHNLSSNDKKSLNCENNIADDVIHRHNIDNSEPRKPYKNDNDECESLYDNCDISQDESNSSISASVKSSTKLKKSVSFDPQDEKVRKFIEGEPIVDQKNPFKQQYSTWGNSARKKKIPPPVPAKRSTLSVRKTVTQQLREREREKEKEKERIKNETNNRKSNSGNIVSLPSPDDFVTTEEVLKQSKYVKTYVKNPDPYFVYDPSILARLKCEETRDIGDKNSSKKLRLTNQTKDRIKDLKSKPSIEASLSHSKIPFKKCSKPNYPDLSDIKIKVGTDLVGNFFNPAEVSKNAKKFDDRVKTLQISSEDDLDEIDGPLTKSESSDEVTPNLVNIKKINSESEQPKNVNFENMDVKEILEEAPEGTFTNTIKSKEFHDYLEKKGLTLIPKKIPNGAQSVYTTGRQITKPDTRISFKSPESVQISLDTTDSVRNTKKPSVFQRLLSNSIFATRRKTTPKDIVPTPKSLNNYKMHLKENLDNPQTSLKRVVLERQSFHGRPHANNNLLSPAETEFLKHQQQQSRKSFASGENLSNSLSSVLPNDELLHNSTAEEDAHTPFIKPSRRPHSKERLVSSQQNRPPPNNTILKPRAHRLYAVNNTTNLTTEGLENSSNGTLKRTVERQSLIPKRSNQTLNRKQIFNRSSSMDRNEILKKRLLRELQNKSKSDNEASEVSTPFTSKENIGEQFSTMNGPKTTSTPIRNANNDAESHSLTHRVSVANKVYVDQQEWERLKAIKDRMDNELYLKMLQEQKRQQDAENIYERLQPQKISVTQPDTMSKQPITLEPNFIRGSPQRNTFAGLTKNRQAKIIDGRALIPSSFPVNMRYISNTKESVFESTPRSQSVLGNMTYTSANGNINRKGYEIDMGTPVVLRRKDNKISEPVCSPEQRRIGGLLTRDEILQKVKDFCRKSLNKTPIIQQSQTRVIHNKQTGPSDLSPVSYASVETNQRPASRMYAAPQVPQRMQSLPQQFIPINTAQMISEINPNTISPIYAHVVKRSSLLSNNSEIYDSPQKINLMRQDLETPALYVEHGNLPTPQYVLVGGDKIVPAKQVFSFYPGQNEIYAQPQYVRPYNLQPFPGAYGYISVQEPISNQHLQHRLYNGRSTPLILDQSSQQASQIYWTPRNQRLQQHSGLQPVNISSPCFMLKQLHSPSTTRIELPNRSNIKTIPNTAELQIQHTATIESRTPNNRQTQAKPSSRQLEDLNNQHSYDWESGSEAGEVRRIFENTGNNGEFRGSHLIRNLKNKLSRLLS